jgi:hypothetical protein
MEQHKNRHTAKQKGNIKKRQKKIRKKSSLSFCVISRDLQQHVHIQGIARKSPDALH